MPVASYLDNLSDQARHAAAVTPADGSDLSVHAKALYIGTAATDIVALW